MLGIRTGISTFVSAFGIAAGSALAALGTAGASLAAVTVGVEVALAGTAIASGSIVLAGTAFSNFGRDFNGFTDNKGLGNFIKIGDDVIELIGKNIVGTNYSKVKPTQDWIDMQQVNDYVKRLKMGEKLSPIEVYPYSKYESFHPGDVFHSIQGTMSFVCRNHGYSRYRSKVRIFITLMKNLPWPP